MTESNPGVPPDPDPALNGEPRTAPPGLHSAPPIRSMNVDDPSRTAMLLIESMGGDARPNAIRQIVAMKAAGDTRAEVEWTRIFGAIVAIEATEYARRQAAESANARAGQKPRQDPTRRLAQRPARGLPSG